MIKENNPTLFVSYSHEDEDWKDRLTDQLKVLSHEGLLDLWDDRRIGVGEDWYKEIQEAIDKASVAILLISAKFLTSEFILAEEVPRLLQRHAQEGMRVFPVIIKPCVWQSVSWLRRMQVRPKDGRPLSHDSESQSDANLAEIANEVFQLLRSSAVLPSISEGPAPIGPDKISISRLPVTGRDLFGRDEELQLLDNAWDDPKTNIVSVVAWGGVGKSALINHWLRRMEKGQYRGCERVYAWSFYRQGTSNHVASADEFVASALTWFGDVDPTKGTVWDKGERLARLIKAQRTLLLLDGLEPLQFPPGQQEGRLKDHALQALLRELAADNPGMCLISTRIPVADLADFEGSTVRQLNLEHLSPQAGAQILKALGVKGAEADLEQAAREYKGHSLALTLLGSYLSDVYYGNISQRHSIGNLEEDVRYGNAARRVMAAYERWFGEGAEVAVLRLLGFFDRPADSKAIAALISAPEIPGLTGVLQNLIQNRWQQILSKLRRARLLAEVDLAEPDCLDAHPLVREHFGWQVRKEKYSAWREGSNRLYEYFKGIAKELPETLQEMEPLFLAVVYGCNAGRHRDALHEVYIPRIMRGNEAFAARKLGAHGTLLSVLACFIEERDWSRPVEPNLPECQGLEPEDQLTVLSQAGLYLTATKGFASQEVMSCYKRVQELCIQLGKTDLLYSVSISQWRYSLVTNELNTTLRLAKDLYSLAESQNDPSLFLGAYRALAVAAYFMGDFELAHQYAKQGIDIWDPERTPSVQEYYAPIVTCLAIDAKALWQLGKPQDAQNLISKALDMARQLSDMNALAVGLFLNCYINQFRRSQQDTLKTAEQLIEVCSMQGFALWLAAGKVFRGWALAMGGKSEKGIGLMNQGLRNWRDAGAGLSVSYFLGLQAEIYGSLGQVKEALSLLDEAQSFAKKFDEYWWMAELYRLKGEMLLQNNSSLDEVESCFNLALTVARERSAKSLESRASLSLIRLWQKMGRNEEARQFLDKARQLSNNGFEPADLQERNL